MLIGALGSGGPAAAAPAPPAPPAPPGPPAPTGPTTCNFCVLDPTAPNALTVSNQSLLVVVGNIVVDSKGPGAQVSDHSEVYATGAVGYVGTWSTDNTSGVQPTPVQTTGAPDCLASATTPVPSGPKLGTVDPASGTVNATPGIYTTLGSAGGTLNLAAGLYTVTSSFVNTNGGKINGTGVTLYFPGSATFHLSSGTSTTLSAGSPSNVLVFYDRANTQKIQLDTGADAILTGDLYAKAGSLSLGSVYVNATCISVDTATVTNGAEAAQLPEGGTYGLVIFLGILAVGIGILFLTSTPRRVAARALARTRRPGAPQAPPPPAPGAGAERQEEPSRLGS